MSLFAAAGSLIVSEYNLLWEALKLYEQHLQKVSSESSDEDEQLFADEKLMKLDGMLKDVRVAAREDWGLELP
ncbi:hypothetical protein [Mitsuaria sp. GD03876]|uniref:hypothetical protein n=1 Tax=Mitsuaria sp. GD03876 TaxID=2975399 RepID=UPI00244ACBBB|nr:hypothetical protein [Mitsuaria sp. GD03876]MDH0866068.1 hypothetical protein [Mitsuaria sp. GD03876]